MGRVGVCDTQQVRSKHSQVQNLDANVTWLNPVRRTELFMAPFWRLCGDARLGLEKLFWRRVV